MKGIKFIWEQLNQLSIVFLIIFVTVIAIPICGITIIFDLLTGYKLSLSLWTVDTYMKILRRFVIGIRYYSKTLTKEQKEEHYEKCDKLLKDIDDTLEM